MHKMHTPAAGGEKRLPGFAGQVSVQEDGGLNQPDKFSPIPV